MGVSGWRALALCACIVSLAGCGTSTRTAPAPGSSAPSDLTAVPDAVPKAEPKSRYGNPKSYVVHGKRYYTIESARGFVERGVASWYGPKFHGRRTSSGEIYDMYAMTAAHKRVPLPTYMSVRNLQNGRQIVVRVNDRGPFHDNRIIDLSYTAALKLDIVQKGTGLVEIRSITPGESVPPPRTAGVAPSGPVEIYLQAGAFSVESNARRLRDRISQAVQEPVTVQEGRLAAGGLLYRVRVGPVASVNDADRLANRIAAMGLETPHIVLDSP